jgi:hypothetical protein
MKHRRVMRTRWPTFAAQQGVDLTEGYFALDPQTVLVGQAGRSAAGSKRTRPTGSAAKNYDVCQTARGGQLSARFSSGVMTCDKSEH